MEGDNSNSDVEVDNTNNADIVVGNIKKEKGDDTQHPYHLKLAEFEPNAWQLEVREPEMYLTLEETKVTNVDTKELLDEMMVTLKQVKEFVIDLGQHRYRDYKRGFLELVCVVRISTRTEDFIIDSSKLQKELRVLNEVCTDINILKVIHHSYIAILWLQRDFGVYVINMFDTLEAARILKEERYLKDILKEVCNVTLAKKYRNASRLINYPREDTHYLLYLYDTYRNKLIQDYSPKDLLAEVYKKSTMLCGFDFEKRRVFKKEDLYLHKDEFSKVKGRLTPRKLECWRLLDAWRHKISREQDESIEFTLPNEMMFEIAMQLPNDSEEIAACCDPLPPLVEENVAHLHTLVMEAVNKISDEEEGAGIKNVGNSSQKVDEKNMKWNRNNAEGRSGGKRKINNPAGRHNRYNGGRARMQHNNPRGRYNPYNWEPQFGGYGGYGPPIPRGHPMRYGIRGGYGPPIPPRAYPMGYEPVHPMGYGPVRRHFKAGW